MQINGLPANSTLKKVEYASQNLSQLKFISLCSINMAIAKSYMDAIADCKDWGDGFLIDAAVVAIVIKYGCVFKKDKNNKSLDCKKIFQEKVIVDNRFYGQNISINDPELKFLQAHNYFIKLRDKFLAHDDRMIGATECFASLDTEFQCNRVFISSTRSPAFTALGDYRDDLPICIDIVYRWLQGEKQRLCQVVNDEINNQKISVRKSFHEPDFSAFSGLPAEYTHRQNGSHWKYDPNTHSRVSVDNRKSPKPT